MKGQGPNDTGEGSQDQVFIDHPVGDDRIENVKRGGADVAVDDSEGDEQSGSGHFLGAGFHKRGLEAIGPDKSRGLIKVMNFKSVTKLYTKPPYTPKYRVADFNRRFTNTHSGLINFEEMKKPHNWYWLLLPFVPLLGWAQKVVYAEPDRADNRRMNFEIIGKVGPHFLIYKNVRNQHWITALDNDMVQVQKTVQAHLPANEQMINIDFVAYSQTAWMIYQHQKKNVVYCMAAQVDATGNLVGEPQELDTSMVRTLSPQTVYTTLVSEDRKRIMVFKVNSRNRQLFRLSTLLFNDQLQLLRRSDLTIPMVEREETLGNFTLDNAGNLAFFKIHRTPNENVDHLVFHYKEADSEQMEAVPLMLNQVWLDEPHLRTDNVNGRFLLSSLAYTERRGHVDGLYFAVWDKSSLSDLKTSYFSFPTPLRQEAKGDAGLRTAFNDHFVRQVSIRRDGGWVIGTESYYTTSRFNTWNRWDYLYGSPFMFQGATDFYYYSPYFNRYFFNNRPVGQAPVRHHADNIAILSFSRDGSHEWSSVVAKSQFNDESDDLLSFYTFIVGGQLHYLMNMPERRMNLLQDFSLGTGGMLNRNPTLRNLDRGYELMPRYAKQVSARQVLLPCIYRNYLCFAKIDYTP